MDVPSTLTPVQIAETMIRYGIAKHNERYGIVFFKAVSYLNPIFPPHLLIDCDRCRLV
jgi:hypothetical protein